MKAYKVENFGRFDIIPMITEKTIWKFTKTRVYFNNGDFENIRTSNHLYPHRWFTNLKEAKQFKMNYMKKKMNYMKVGITKIRKEFIKMMEGKKNDGNDTNHNKN